MKMRLIGDEWLRNERCWNAIVGTVEKWKSTIDGAIIEARIGHSAETLELTLCRNGKRIRSAELDVTWIAYADQSDRFESKTMSILHELEAEALSGI